MEQKMEKKREKMRQKMMQKMTERFQNIASLDHCIVPRSALEHGQDGVIYSHHVPDHSCRKDHPIESVYLENCSEVHLGGNRSFQRHYHTLPLVDHRQEDTRG